MTNREIVNAINGISAIKERKEKMPVRVAWIIQKNLKRLVRAYEPYDEVREKIMDGYDNKPQDEKEKAAKDLNELLEQRNDDIHIDKITLEELEQCVGLTIGDIEALEFMVQE